MFAFQINVAAYGRHLFRTDWDNDSDRAGTAFLELRHRFPEEQGYSVTVLKRSLLQSDAKAELLKA